MKKHILMAAVAASLMLAGCGSGADDEAVTVTVTGSANVRDAATAEGSSVLETLSAGTELTGRWVKSDANPSEQWFEYERDGKKAYLWGRNLSERSHVPIASKEHDNQSPDRSEMQFDYKASSPNILRAKAERWWGCSITSLSMAAMLGADGMTELGRDRLESSRLFANFAIYLVVETGKTKALAEQILKNGNYLEKDRFTQLIESKGRGQHIADQISKDEESCWKDFKNGVKLRRDHDLIYVIKKYSVGENVKL